MNIEELMQRRGIMHLVHFTRAENLRSILSGGLIPRMWLNGDSAIFNDEFRYDRCEDAVCASIEFPNYKMFYQLREANSSGAWVVLLLSAQILLDFDCAFCQTNAGSEASYAVPLAQRQGAGALAALYAPMVGGVPRAGGLPLSYPTDPQAEVLVFGIIPPEYIEAVYFNSYTTMRKFSDLFHMVNMRVNTDFFYPRADYRRWQNTAAAR